MPENRKHSGMTIRRIVALVVLLTLASQAVLISIGMTYANSINRSMSVQRGGVVADQLQRNMTNRLNDVNNLLLVLQTPEFSDFFRQLMNLREPAYVAGERRKLLENLQALQISRQEVESIYFIGLNANQASYRMDVGSDRFVELPGLHSDVLDSSKVSNLFLRDHDQFVRYGKQELLDAYDPSSRLIEPSNKQAIDSFLAGIQDRLILTNSNQYSLLVVLVLNEQLFGMALPQERGIASYSVVNDRNRVLWTTASGAVPSPASCGPSQPCEGNGDPGVTSRELPAFHLHIVISSELAGRFAFRSRIWEGLLAVSFGTLVLASFISFFYMKKVFQPFRLISSKMKNKLKTNSNEMVLQPIPEKLIAKGFQAVSLRNKLILLFCITVSLPSALNGLWYAHFLNREVHHWAEQSAKMLGDFSVVGVAGQASFLENTANEISVSQQFQNYLTNNLTNHDRNFDALINLNMYPGLIDLSYFVLLDPFGTSLYSSIYSNNKDIFSVSPKYLEDRDDPYWVSDYEDIFNRVSVAVFRKIELDDRSDRVTYLLLVPKDSVFQIAESEQIRAGYAITDGKGLPVSSHNYAQDGGMSSPHRYDSAIPGTDWHIQFQYWFQDIVNQNRVYQQQYLLCILMVFLLAAGIAVWIASVMTKPIKQLKETMLAAGNEGFARQLHYEGSNEIAGIIVSYNHMIVQLQQTARENMQMMEENARTKIRENELLKMKMQAELNMLQAQINPHFLYNTLETINMQSMKRGHHEISRTVNALGDLLRYSIAKGAETALLDKELNHAANYLTIQKVRFGGSFEAEFDVPDELRQYHVLRFILQPLIENSIKHGFGGWDSGGKIVVSAALENGRLLIRVRDNGVGMDEMTLAKLRADLSDEPGEWAGAEDGREADPHGIGLRNVYLRLKLFYKGGMSMEIDSVLMRGTEIAMRIPVDAEGSGGLTA
ncbi:sensor histidine kinase [Cohnella zeiphila]|uniref:Sensor histidine kinase n=1 Tax=Cohnella zeiphila TaxID=2761120 RepID=A0A7X0VVN4_9BACL|nr:sensor histidine kinase [Cohnella zeiphila]MBB6732339.1 sensor histidine kinase [Cohnella zeiphila]